MKGKIVPLIMAILLIVSAMDFGAISFITSVVGSESGSNDWWLMFRHDISHTGYSTEPAPTRNDTALKPKFPFPTNGTIYSSPAVANYTVFVGSNDGKLYAFDLEGKHKWNVSLGGPVYSSPAFDSGIVFVGSLNGSVYAVYAHNGTIKWNNPTKGPVYSSPIIANGLVFIGSNDYNLYALNATNGYVIWTFPTGAPVRSSPAILNGRIFFGVDDGRVYALNVSTFRYLWHFETGGSVRSSPAVADGLVFVGSLNGIIYALNETSGSEVWKYPTDGLIHSSPAVAYGKVFIGSNDNKTYALDECSGTLIWNFTAGGEVCSSPAVANSTVFIGSMDSQVYALNEADGSVRWNYTTGGAVWSSPAVADKKVFVGSTDKMVYAFEEPNIKPVPVKTHYPEYPIICQTVIFDASSSYDPDGYIVRWDWSFGDGATASGEKVPHVYEAAGTYTVTLTVTDDRGEFNLTSQLIKVLEAWPMYRHDFKRWGSSTSLAPVANITIWIQRICHDVRTDFWMYSSAAVLPTVTGNVVFVGSTNGTVYALNATNGEVIWSKTPAPGFKFYSSPAFADGLVFIGSEDGRVYALNATNGNIKYSITTGSPVYSSVAVIGDRVFVGSQDTRVYAFYTNGTTLWTSSPLDGALDSSPAIADSKVFVGTWNGSVYALNETTGTLIWRKNLTPGKRIYSSPAFAYDKVFIGSTDKKVYALNAANGNILWNVTTGDEVYSSPTVAHGIVFIGSMDNNLYALNATTSALIWSKSIGQIKWSSPAVSEGKVFIGTVDWKIYALRERDGEVWWSYQTGGPVDSSPAVLNDTLYVGSKDGKLYAFWGQVHDIAVINVTASPTRVVQNETTIITAIAENQGSFNETGINITFQYNDTIFYSTFINLNRGDELTLQIPWNTSGVELGNYIIRVNATLAPPLTDYEPTDNSMDVNVAVEFGTHNIKVTDVWTGYNVTDPAHRIKTVVGQNYNVTIYIIVKNEGNFTEYNITVTAYWSNSTHINQTIGSAIISELPINATVTVSITWSTNATLTGTYIAKGNYTITAYAEPVPYETNTDDNTFVDNWVIVTITGDLTEPYFQVDMGDIIALCEAFGSTPSTPKWSANCDIDNDFKVRMDDIMIAIGNFGKTDP